MIANTPFKINQYQIIPAEFSIQIADGEKQSLQPKFIEVLVYLAHNYGRVVPREELINHIWGQDSYVGEKSLTNAIWHLRKKLVCDEEVLIKTIRKAGYQLISKPQWQSEEKINLSQKASQTAPVESSINYSVANAIDSSPEMNAEVSLSANSNSSSLGNSNRHNHSQKNAANNSIVNINNTYLLLVTLIIILSALLLFQQVPDDKTHKITAITKHPGSELFPAPSPDGRYVVYSQTSTNQATNLYMQDTHQPQLAPKQLTFDNASQGHSVWSNDGKYLYFSRKNKTDRSCHYIQLNIASQQERQIATCPMQGIYYYLDISPDDKTLAVYNKDLQAIRTGIYFIDLTSDNFDMTRFSCNSDCNYKDRDMVFSPDGKYLAVSRRINRLSENIYLINLATKDTEQITFDEEDIVGMSWFEDSQNLVFAVQRADTRFGFIIDIEDKLSKSLDLTGFSYPSVAKQSQQIYYQERKDNSSLVSLKLNDDIANSPFPVLQSNFTYESPDYSLINDLVVFSSNESGFDELWIAKPDGSERKQLTTLQLSIRYPKWSHDGEKIAFLAPLPNNEGDSIYIYSLQDDRVSLLKSPFRQHNRPSWSFNDDEIISAIYGEQHTDIYRINIANGSTQRLTTDGGRYGLMISEDILLYTKLEKGLWQKNITSIGSETSVISGADFNTIYAWTYNKGDVYYQKLFDDHYQLVFYNLTRNIVMPLVRLPLDTMSKTNSLTYIENSDRLLYTSGSFPQANIKMLMPSIL
jgi:Tol biopolymer transport system component/DNA-binding winged helix-turn-helix (wHTH) protein